MDNVWVNWGNVFAASLQSVWWAFIQFVPKLILAVLLFVIGWALGGLLKKAFEEISKSLKLDKLFGYLGLGEVMRKAGLSLNVGYFLGEIVKWFSILVFFFSSLSLIGLDYITSFIRYDVLGFVSRVVVAAFILIVATLVARFVSKIAYASGKAMGLTSARMLSTLTKWAVWIFAGIVALGQIGVPDAYMSIVFTGLVAMLALGGALAFGLGAKDQAGRLISRLGEEMSHRE